MTWNGRRWLATHAAIFLSFDARSTNRAFRGWNMKRFIPMSVPLFGLLLSALAGVLFVGAAFYHTICGVCHGADGREINFATEDDPSYIGTVANENPWETLHKIRNGQPGVAMVALRVLDTQQQVDILAYTQTLPTR